MSTVAINKVKRSLASIAPNPSLKNAGQNRRLPPCSTFASKGAPPGATGGSPMDMSEAYRELQRACKEGSAERVVELILILKEASPEGQKLRGVKPPLYWAVVYGKLNVVRELIERCGFSPKFVTESGKTLLHVACSRGHVDVAKYLVCTHHLEPTATHKDGSTPLVAACYNGRLEVAKFLIEELGCDATLFSETEGSLLHVVCSKGQLKLARYLVNTHCLDPTVAMGYGETPVHLASSDGHLDVVKYLAEELDCALQVRDAGGNTPLHVSAQNGHHEVVQYLLERKCDPEARNNEGCTPLLLACLYGRSSTAKVLLNVGKADPNCQNDNNESALQLTRDKVIFKQLIQCGANTTNIVSDVFQYHKDQIPLESLVRMFVVGHPSSGKSTLAQALQEVTGIFSKREVTGVTPQTAGIVPMEFESSEFGRVLLFDFAGQNEYYASHAALLEVSKSSSAPLFMLVVNLLKDEKEIKHRIIFWLSFINQHHVPGTSVAHVLVIGSHKDVLKKQNPSTYSSKIAMVEALARSAVEEHSSLHMAGFFAKDCRKPHKHGKLRSTIRQSCKELRSDKKVDVCCHILSAFLCEAFRGEMTCTVGEIISKVKERDLPLPCKPERVCELAEALSERQNILFLRNDTDILQSWIVMEVDTLLTKINGYIFAPINFKEHCINNSSGTGVLAWSDIQKTFGELGLDPNLVVAFLGKLEFCEEVIDENVLNLIQHGTAVRLRGRSTSPSCSVYSDDEPDSARGGHRRNTTPNCSLIPTAHEAASMRKQSLPTETRHTTTATSLLSTSLSVCKPTKSSSNPNIQCTAHLAPLQSRLSRSCAQLDSDSERYFFFPGLLHHERPHPEKIWSADDTFTFHTGWCIQISSPNQYFMPRFLQILLLRVAFGFATAKKNPENGSLLTRQCTVWKNGLRWLDLDGIETLVEMVEQNRAVIVLMRGKERSELKCVSLRSKLVRLILEVKKKFCPNLPVAEYLLNAKELANRSYPLLDKSLDEFMLYDMTTIIQCIVEMKDWVYDRREESKSFCHPSSLVHFEPYSNLGEEMLSRLYQDTEVTDNHLHEFLYEFAQVHSDRDREMSEILGVRGFSPMSGWDGQSQCSNRCMAVLERWWDGSCSLSMADFREKLDEYSLFAKRNLLVSE